MCATEGTVAVWPRVRLCVCARAVRLCVCACVVQSAQLHACASARLRVCVSARVCASVHVRLRICASSVCARARLRG
eukprot:1661191-Alexandrium_andersonii.AAC.1